jgi:hypothetical protein
MADITVVWAGEIGSDWLGLYKDGEKVFEGHPPDTTEVLDLLGIPYADRVWAMEDMEVPGVRGLPQHLGGGG